jgi:hypothetical protein
VDVCTGCKRYGGEFPSGESVIRRIHWMDKAGREIIAIINHGFQSCSFCSNLKPSRHALGLPYIPPSPSSVPISGERSAWGIHKKKQFLPVGHRTYRPVQPATPSHVETKRIENERVKSSKR